MCFGVLLKLVSLTLQNNYQLSIHFDILSLLKLTRKDILGVTEKTSMSVHCCAFLVSILADIRNDGRKSLETSLLFLSCIQLTCE